jgi:hypothetical protein
LTPAASTVPPRPSVIAMWPIFPGAGGVRISTAPAIEFDFQLRRAVEKPVESVAHPCAGIGVGERRIRGVADAAVQPAGRLEDEPRREFGAIPRTVPVPVVLRHLDVHVFLADARFGEREKLGTSGHANLSKAQRDRLSGREPRAYDFESRASRSRARRPIPLAASSPERGTNSKAAWRSVILAAVDVECRAMDIETIDQAPSEIRLHRVLWLVKFLRALVLHVLVAVMAAALYFVTGFDKLSPLAVDMIRSMRRRRSRTTSTATHSVRLVSPSPRRCCSSCS